MKFPPHPPAAASRRGFPPGDVRGRRCPLCLRPGNVLLTDLEDALYKVEGRWSIMACAGCGIAWLAPRPSRDDFDRIYQDYFTHFQARADDPSRTSVRKRIKEAALDREMGVPPVGTPWALRTAAAVALRIPRYRELVHAATLWVARTEGGTLLDVGCGDGAYLKRMRDLGWSVRGIDPDRRAVELARARLGQDVMAARLEESRYPEAAFDAVVASHVIEHVEDPLAFLAECRRILKTGGKLVVLTPNFFGLQRRWLGRRWIGFDCPRHLWFFSRRSLRHCCELSGLDVVTVRSTAREGKNHWRLSRRQTAVHLEPPGRRHVRLRLEALLYDWVERSALRLWPDAGSELLLIAHR